MSFLDLNTEKCAVCRFPVISYKWPRIFDEEVVCFSCFKYISDIIVFNNMSNDFKLALFDSLNYQYRSNWYDYHDLRKNYDELLDEKWGRKPSVASSWEKYEKT